MTDFGTMYAMVLESRGEPLKLKKVPIPVPHPDQVLVKIISCGICRTDLHILDGELPEPKLPLIPGHEIIGQVVRTGGAVAKLQPGQFVGIPWLGYTCGKCRYCKKGEENLCENALFTGYTMDGGYAQYIAAYEKYCFPICDKYANPNGSPLLCAGLIGYRSYRMILENSCNIGIYGFGAAAHILVQLATFQHKKIFAFTREADIEAQNFALSMGAFWAGSSMQAPPEILDAAIIFAPAGELIPQALAHIDKAGSVICGGIHMSDIPRFPYKLLWEERIIRSVANLTRADAENFLAIAPLVPVKTEIQLFPLAEANEAIKSLRQGKIRGAAVLSV